MCAPLILLASFTCCQIDEPGFNNSELSCIPDSSMRFLAIHRQGNGPDITGKTRGVERAGHLVVLEYVAYQSRLRVLHERALLSSRWPLITKLSRDGRFFLTLDDWRETGIGPYTIVIYDLVRNEHSAFRGSDFIPANVIAKLPQRGPGFAWTMGWGEFNRDSTQFFPNTPEMCRSKGYPFVVVDLPSRTVRVESGFEHFKDAVPFKEQRWGWRESMETVSTETTILPLRLKRQSWDRFPREQHIPKQLFELSADRREYVLVGESGSRTIPDP